jgi:hypothetical protein
VFTDPPTFTSNVVLGSSYEGLTSDCAARWNRNSGRDLRTAADSAARSRTSPFTCRMRRASLIALKWSSRRFGGSA